MKERLRNSIRLITQLPVPVRGLNGLSGLALILSTIVAGCGSTSVSPGDSATGVSVDAITPRITGDRTIIESATAQERAHLQLISTNLVSTLVQLPGMQTSDRTLQISQPSTVFGHAIVRALEDVGYGLQVVSADQGKNYVSYSKRLSETESGLINDYSLGVGKVQVSREYQVQEDSIYPSSLMSVSGAAGIDGVELADDIFAEQGGSGGSFISGVQETDSPNPNITVRTIDVNDFDEIPVDKRTPQNAVLTQAQLRSYENTAKRDAPNLDDYYKYRRTVLLFDNTTTRVLGNGNKRAVKLLSREFSDGDIMLIKACQDADGINEAAMGRAIRVEQELRGLGVPGDFTYIAPCVRANYRHSSDNSPTPVELIHYRPRT